MKIKEWIKDHWNDENGEIKVYNKRKKMFMRIEAAEDLEVLKVEKHRGWGYKQINTTIITWR